MTSRRAFIQAGVALSAAVSSPSIAAAAPTARERLPLYRVVFDARFAASRAFGEAARAQGARTAAIVGDVTRLWQGELDPQWRATPAAIAGLTTNRSFYMLEVVARDHGMRVIFHADHRPIAGDVFAHRLVGPDTLAAPDFLGGEAWPAQVARLVTAWPSGAHTPLGTTGDLMIPSGAGEPLVSFVIAPIDRA